MQQRKYEQSYIAEQHIQRAKSFYIKKQYTQAREAYVNALHIEPKNIEWLAQLGIVEYCLENYHDAVDCLYQSVSANDKNAEWFSKLAAALYKLNRIEESCCAAEKAASLGEKSIFFAQVAICHFKLSNWRPAREAYLKALSLSPNQPGWLKILADIEYKNGLYSKAETYYKRALEITPDKADWYSKLAAAAAKQGRMECALEALSKAISIEPNNHQYRGQQGACYITLKNWDMAEKSYEAALSIAQDKFTWLFFSGKCAMERGDWKTGKKRISDALENSAVKPEFWTSTLARGCIENQDFGLLEEIFHSSSGSVQAYIIGQVAQTRLQQLRYNINASNHLYSDCKNFSPEYMEDIFSQSGLVPQENTIWNVDVSSKYFNIKNGRRVTIGNPDEFEKTIYVFGSSWTVGFGSEDSNTIPSFLQYLYNKNNNKVRVLNYGVKGGNCDITFLQFANMEFKKGDSGVLIGPYIGPRGSEPTTTYNYILNMHQRCKKQGVSFVVFLYPRLKDINAPSHYERALLSRKFSAFLGECPPQTEDITSSVAYLKNVKKHFADPALAFLNAHGCPTLDLQPLIQRPHNHGEIFFDSAHLTHRGNKIIAEYIYDTLNKIPEGDLIQEDDLTKLAINNYYKTFFKLSYGPSIEIQQWISHNICDKFYQNKLIGSIVMNLNPFTLGHLHLIQEALERIDYLYIFVVEEDKSFFNFSDRMAMVSKGTHHLDDRIHIIPSGKFIISSASLPGYFCKETIVEPTDASYDIGLFGAVIAPAFNITHRFVGEEPTCVVTNSYNKTIQYLLPPMGVQVHILPRKQYDDKHVISASTVRKAMKDGDHKLIKCLVPQTTYEYLIKNNLIK